jgi:SAM-dependent methyltransferase
MSLEYLSHLARLGTADIHPGTAAASDALLAALALEDGLAVLEIGCGTGTTLVRVARAAGVQLTGFDMLPEMLARAAQRIAAAGLAGRVDLVHGHAKDLPFADESFGRVYCESVIACHSDAVLRRTFAEIRRVLRPGGRFACNEEVWKPGVDDALAARINENCLRDFGMMRATEHAWHRADWHRELAAAGLRVTGDALVDGARKRANNGAARPLGRSASWAARLAPAAIAGHLRYRRLIRAYQPLSAHVEARLFVAERD